MTQDADLAKTIHSSSKLFFTFNRLSLPSGEVMAELDPETLLEWLALGQGDERDIQLLALEQLCMLLLMSDNVDKCFEM